jgi:hypothetical protein
VTTYRTHIGEIRFKAVAYSRQVGVNGVRFDERASKNDVKGKSIHRGFDRQCMRTAEGYVTIQGRGIGGARTGFESHTHGNGSLVQQALEGPGVTTRLPAGGGKV